MVGLSTRKMRKKPIGSEHLLDIKPLTPSQEKVFEAWEKQKNMFLFGAAGTGKSFVTMYLALRDILDEKTPYNKLYVVRSLVPTREIGFLPGDHEDKANLYQNPYKNMVRFMIELPDAQSFEMHYATHLDGHKVSVGLLNRGIYAKETHHSTVRLAPALTIQEAQIDILLNAIHDVIKNI